MDNLKNQIFLVRVLKIYFTMFYHLFFSLLNNIKVSEKLKALLLLPRVSFTSHCRTHLQQPYTIYYVINGLSQQQIVVRLNAVTLHKHQNEKKNRISAKNNQFALNNGYINKPYRKEINYLNS